MVWGTLLSSQLPLEELLGLGHSKIMKNAHLEYHFYQIRASSSYPGVLWCYGEVDNKEEGGRRDQGELQRWKPALPLFHGELHNLWKSAGDFIAGLDKYNHPRKNYSAAKGIMMAVSWGIATLVADWAAYVKCSKAPPHPQVLELSNVGWSAEGFLWAGDSARKAGTQMPWPQPGPALLLEGVTSVRILEVGASATFSQDSLRALKRPQDFSTPALALISKTGGDASSKPIVIFCAFFIAHHCRVLFYCPFGCSYWFCTGLKVSSVKQFINSQIKV